MTYGGEQGVSGRYGVSYTTRNMSWITRHSYQGISHTHNILCASIVSLSLVFTIIIFFNCH
jgi:hypothetical protein